MLFYKIIGSIGCRGAMHCAPTNKTNYSPYLKVKLHYLVRKSYFSQTTFFGTPTTDVFTPK
jgi:hypothetical protein